jgi:uroporphyrinogen-III synthase
MNPESPRVGFEGLSVAAFESRHAAEMATLIERYGGAPRVAPSMQEVPLEENAAAFEFGGKLIAGKFHVVIFMTGVGTEMLIQVLENRHPREEIVRALSATLIVARGPKSVRALKNLQIPIAITLPDPHTSQLVVRALDEYPGGFAWEGSRIALQEYGAPNQDLVDELERRGAHVLRVPVYRWALPENTGPLRGAVHAIIDGQARVVLFTNAVQIDHLMQVAGEKRESLRNALRRSVVCSVGPTCSEALRNHGIGVDLEPEQHKMGSLVYEAAGRAPALLKQKNKE